MTDTRTPTAVDAVADRHLDEVAELDPITAPGVGVAGHDDRLPDFTPDWWRSRSEQHRRTLAALAQAEPADSTDRVTVAALRQELELAEELRASGADEMSLDVIASPLQGIRDVFDLTPTTTVDHWATVWRGLGAVPTGVEVYIESLRFGGARGNVAARRQVEAGAGQCADNVGPDGFFAKYAATAAPDSGGELPDSLKAELDAGARAASEAYEKLGAFLRDELLSQAPERDAIGRELSPLHSRVFLGAAVDLEETYELGQQELARITAEMAATANRIKPGATVDEA